MRLVSYQAPGQVRLAVLAGEKIIDLQHASRLYSQTRGKADCAGSLAHMPDLLSLGPAFLRTISEIIEFILEGLPGNLEVWQKQGMCYDFDQIVLLAPVPRPGKIICVAGNYPSTPGQSPPDYPILFLKPSSSVTGCGWPIRIPQAARDVAYEAELAIVIGQSAKYLSEQAAWSCIAGFMLANDLGERNLEKRTSQWTTGKLMDTFTPLGPALVTIDEVPNAEALSIQTRLNGVVVQKGCTADMFFGISYLVSYISTLTTLEPGDIILTGSPKLIDELPAPTIALQVGDIIEVEIGNLGKLSNRACDEGPGLA